MTDRDIFPPENESAFRHPFLELVTILRFQLSEWWNPEDHEWGSLQVRSFMIGGEPARDIHGLTAWFTLPGRELLLARWEFPTGHFVLVAVRKRYANSRDPYVRPFDFIPIQFLPNYELLTKGSDDAVADAVAAANQEVARWPIAYSFFR